MDKLKKGETYVGKPVYEKDPITENLNSYVEIDITKANVFMYLNGECILENTNCNRKYWRRILYSYRSVYLNNKVRDTVLRGSNRDGSKYASRYCIGCHFYKGFGMHDANWRNKFGGEIYKNNGSHGCVNLQLMRQKQYAKTLLMICQFFYKS